MCLGVPGRLIEWVDRDPLFASARVEFAGVIRTCNMACVPAAEVGDYVVVHAGIGISLINEVAARLALSELEGREITEQTDGLRDDSAAEPL